MSAPRVLVYGDSNSWGYPPDGSGLRMARDVRWPGVFAGRTGAEVIEECLPGRTVDIPDPEGLGEGQNGRAVLPAILLSHQPVDLVLIMLGTNDLKARFARSGAEVATGLMGLAQLVRATGGAGASWEDDTPPRIGLIAPPAPGPRVSDPGWERLGEWRGAGEKARDLTAALLGGAAAAGIPAFDAAGVAAGAAVDPIHLDADTHVRLGRAVAGWAQAAFPEILG